MYCDFSKYETELVGLAFRGKLPAGFWSNTVKLDHQKAPFRGQKISIILSKASAACNARRAKKNVEINFMRD